MNHIPVESLEKLSSYSSVLPWLHLPFRFRTAKKGWKLISTVIWDFFLLQNFHKFKITNHPVIFVNIRKTSLTADIYKIYKIKSIRCQGYYKF